MALYGRTTFFEKTPESPDEQYTLDAARVVRKLLVPNATAAVRQQAVADFLGSNTLITSNVLNGPSARWISRQIPMSYAWVTTNPALKPSAAYLFASNIVRGRTVGRPTGIFDTADPVFNTIRGTNVDWYEYTVEFTTRTYDIKGDRFVIGVAPNMVPSGFGFNVPALNSFPPGLTGFVDEGQLLAGIAFTTYPAWPPASLPKFSTGTRYITRYFRPSSRLRVLPYGLATWSSDNQPIREGVPINEAMAEVTYVWHLVPEAAIPTGAIQNCFNGVNAYWFDSFAPNTLLFSSVDLRRSIGPLGDVLYDVQYKFHWLPKNSYGVFNPGGAGGTIPRPGPPQGANPGLPLGWNAQLRAKSPGAGQPTQLDYEWVQGAPGQAQIFPGKLFQTLFVPDQS